MKLIKFALTLAVAVITVVAMRIDEEFQVPTLNSMDPLNRN